MADDEEAVNYADNSAIRSWIAEPLTKAMSDKKVKQGGSSKRPTLVDTEGNKGTLNEVKGQVEKRVNLLGQQRPHCLKSKKDNRKIYYTHSALGGTVKMKEVGLEKRGRSDFSGSAGAGCGGELAPAVNALFRLAICGYDEHNQKVKPMPEEVIYLGDTNVTSQGMDQLFPDVNRATSGDGWCHVLTKYDMEVVSTSRNDADVGPSDHDWIIVDVDNPT